MPHSLWNCYAGHFAATSKSIIANFCNAINLIPVGDSIGNQYSITIFMIISVSSNFASADFRKIKTYNFQKSESY